MMLRDTLVAALKARRNCPVIVDVGGALADIDSVGFSAGQDSILLHLRLREPDVGPAPTKVRRIRRNQSPAASDGRQE